MGTFLDLEIRQSLFAGGYRPLILWAINMG